MKPGPQILERNLEALLQRAYVPAVPRESFRRALLEDFATRASSRAGLRDHAGSAPGPRSSLVFRTALAAAAVLLILFAVGQLREAPASGDGALDPGALLAAGNIAVRHAPAGGWVGSGSEVALEGDFLEVATPPGRSAFVTLARASAELEPGAQAAFNALTAPASAAIQLERGGLRVSARGELELDTPGGSLTLLAGTLRVGPGAPAPLPDTWPSAPQRGWWSVYCLSGRAALPAGEEEPAAPVSLSAGQSAFLSAGRTWLPPAATSTRLADESRREVVAVAGPTGGEPTGTEPPVAPAIDPPSAGVPPPVLFGLVQAPASSEPGAASIPVTRFQVILLEEVALPRVVEPEIFPREHPEGAFELADVAPGSYRLFVRAEGHALWHSEKFVIRAGDDPLELTVQMEAGRSLRGIVVDGVTGNPIAGAVVLSETDAPLQILSVDTAEHPEKGLVRTVTGADGGFELEHLSSRPQVVRASAAGYAPEWSGRMEEDASGLLPLVEFELEAGGVITGVVEDDAGLGVAGSQIITSLTDFTSAHPVMTYVGVTTDEQGHFEMRDLPRGAWTVLNFGAIRDASEAVAPDLAFVQVFNGETTEVSFKQTLGTVRVHGVVTDSKGKPVAGRSIWLTPWDGRGPESMQSTTTAADGAYEFSVQPDKYALSISGLAPTEMYVLASLDTTAGLDQELDLQLSSGSLSGRVRHGETGRGLGEVVLICAREGGSGLDLDFVGQALADADGNFEFATLAPGRYEVVAFSANGLGEERTGVLDVGDEPLEGVDLVLWPGGALELTVEGPEGPVADALVRFQRRGGGWVRFGEMQRTTEQGRYVVPGLRAEAWTVVIEAQGFETLVVTLAIPLGKTLRKRLELRPR